VESFPSLTFAERLVPPLNPPRYLPIFLNDAPSTTCESPSKITWLLTKPYLFFFSESSVRASSYRGQVGVKPRTRPRPPFTIVLLRFCLEQIERNAPLTLFPPPFDHFILINIVFLPTQLPITWLATILFISSQITNLLPFKKPFHGPDAPGQPFSIDYAGPPIVSPLPPFSSHLLRLLGTRTSRKVSTAPTPAVFRDFGLCGVSLSSLVPLTFSQLFLRLFLLNQGKRIFYKFFVSFNRYPSPDGLRPAFNDLLTRPILSSFPSATPF